MERFGEAGDSFGVERRLLGERGASCVGEIMNRLGEAGEWEIRSFGVETRLLGDRVVDCLGVGHVGVGITCLGVEMRRLGDEGDN